MFDLRFCLTGAAGGVIIEQFRYNILVNTYLLRLEFLQMEPGYWWMGFISLVRCFKCARYGHMVSKWQNKEICIKCTGTHKTNDCESIYLHPQVCTLLYRKQKIQKAFQWESSNGWLRLCMLEQISRFGIQENKNLITITHRKWTNYIRQ